MSDSPIPDLAHALGAHPLQLALAGEGSCACRLPDNRMIITRRGADLARVATADVVEMDLTKAQALLNNDHLPEEGLAGALAGGVGDPSSDALVYAHLFAHHTARLAAHVQPVEINQIISSPRARQFADRRTTAAEVAACGVGTLLVPYADPGFALAKEVKKKLMLWMDRYRAAPRLLLIQNHGLIVLGDDPWEILRTIEAIMKSARVFIGSAAMGGPMFLTPNNVTYLEGLKEL